MKFSLSAVLMIIAATITMHWASPVPVSVVDVWVSWGLFSVVAVFEFMKTAMRSRKYIQKATRKRGGGQRRAIRSALAVLYGIGRRAAASSCGERIGTSTITSCVSTRCKTGLGR